MKDCNGYEIQREWILKSNDGFYRRVLSVGKERIITASLNVTLEKARTEEFCGITFTQEEINNYQMATVQTRTLRVYDANGKEYYVGSMVGEREVFETVKSFKGDGADYVLVRDENYIGGWTSFNAKNATITSTPFETPDIKVDFKLWVNGKESTEPLSVETAKRLGVVK